MAKISPVSIKYTIHAKFEAEGTVEKPDIIGALFGQTEGLLGSELEMRELQKEGKIGRIDVDVKSENGKSIGIIKIPSAMDKADTTIIAAALETIERIGPSNAKIEIEKIEDVRGNKRQYIVERAKKLLQNINSELPESREITESVKVSSRISKLQEYGAEKLPAGDISGDEIIVVEGRADVINLLKAGVSNVIAMNGTILPNTIKELSKEKEIVLFVDGDRGGKLIVKNVVANANVSAICQAPDGKEVEELSGKEILSVLRKKIRPEEFLGKSDKRQMKKERKKERRPETEEKEMKKEAKKLAEKDKEKLQKIMDDIRGKKKAVLLDENLKIIKRTTPGNLARNIKQDSFIIITDSTATIPVIRSAEKANVKYIVASNFTTTDTNIELLSL